MEKNELDEYTEKYLIPNGYYKIDQVLYSKEEALKIFENKYIYTIQMQVSTKIDEGCGFIIDN